MELRSLEDVFSQYASVALQDQTGGETEGAAAISAARRGPQARQ